jgi:hypothetical protein
MRNIIKEIYERTDIRHIRSFLIDGLEDMLDTRTLEQKLDESNKIICRCLEKLCPNENELDRVSDDIWEALMARENVYTEIGMRVGARIIFQLLLQDEL